jgi:hypothetical protein
MDRSALKNPVWMKPDSISNDMRIISNISGPTAPAFTLSFQNNYLQIWANTWQNPTH